MMQAFSYTVNGKEYMVLNASDDTGYMPQSAGIRLLADRHQGIGADRVLVFTGTEEEPSMLVYTPEGCEVEADTADYRVLVRYLADVDIAANPAEIARALGDHAFIEAAAANSISRVEFRLTANFVSRMREADEKNAAKERLAV